MKTKQFIFSLMIVLFAMSSSFAQTTKTIAKASISDKSSGLITHGEMIAKTITITPETYTVQSFTVTVTNSEGVVNVDVLGNIVNKKASNQIRTLPAGSEVIVGNIKAQNDDGDMISVADMIFILQ